MIDNKVKDIVYISLLAAIICVATFMIRIPSLVTNGYVHLGDGLIFIAVILLGGKRGAFSASIGAALADILGGYAHYAIPTFIIKGIMALIMGYVIYKMDKESKISWVIGAVLGSIWQVGAYYLVGSLMVGSFISTLMEIPSNGVQSIVGIIVAVIFVVAFKNTSISRKILE